MGLELYHLANIYGFHTGWLVIPPFGREGPKDILYVRLFVEELYYSFNSALTALLVLILQSIQYSALHRADDNLMKV